MAVSPELVQRFVHAKMLKAAAAALHDTVAEELAIAMSRGFKEKSAGSMTCSVCREKGLKKCTCGKK